jgi:hypothetical protein
MSRRARLLLPGLVTIDIAWRTFSPIESTLRDLILYNVIWCVALIFVLSAPLNLDRVALAAIALAITFWGLGSLAASIDELVLDSPRFTLATQILYTLFYPLMMIAIPRLAASQSQLRPIELLDALIFGLGFTSIIATFLLVTIFPSQSLFYSDDYFSIFYPVGDLALLLISLITLLTKGFQSQLALFAIGIFIFTATDIYYLWLALNHQYSF